MTIIMNFSMIFIITTFSITDNSIFIDREGEFLLDTNVQYIHQPDYQHRPYIASDGVNHMVIWFDTRNLDDDVYGARINNTGQIMDPAGFLIAGGVGHQGCLNICYGIESYLVIWHQNINSHWVLHATLLDTCGQLQNTVTLPSYCVNPMSQGCTAFGDSIFLVVWQDNQTYSTILGMRLDQYGVVIDTSPIVISSNGHESWPAVAFDGNNFMVVWNAWSDSTSEDIYGKRVNQSGQVLDSASIIISAGDSIEIFPTIASAGMNYLVAWSNNWLEREIRVARVDTNGILLDTNSILVSPNGDRPVVTVNSINYLVTWEGAIGGVADIFGKRITPLGVIIDTAAINITDDIYGQGFSQCTSDGYDYFIVWEDAKYWGYGGGHDICGARLSQAGVVLDTQSIFISTDAYDQDQSDIAFDGSNYFVVWEDWRNESDKDIYGTLIDQDGNILYPQGIPICMANGQQEHPAVIPGDAGYLVVWDDYRNIYTRPDIYVARVTQSGLVLDTNGIQITNSTWPEWFPAVAFDGTNYFVAWNVNGYDIYGKRVDQNGIVMDTAAVEINNITYGIDGVPSIAYDGTNYIIVWSGVYQVNDIWYARVTTDAVVLDTIEKKICVAQNYQRSPDVVFDGMRYFVTWEDWRNGTDNDIYGTIVYPSGIVLDTFGYPISIANANQMHPHTAFNGTDYVVVWEDERSDYLYDIFGARVDTACSLIDTFIVSISSGQNVWPNIFSKHNGQSFITYTGFVDTINGRPANTCRIWGKFHPFSDIQESILKTGQKTEFFLQIYPSFFKKECKIRYLLPRETLLNISMYDVMGRLVEVIVNEKQKPGVYTKKYEVTNISQGVYFVRLNAGQYSVTKKVILTK